MFWLMVKGALIRQKNRCALIALTVALGVSLAAAMFNVMFDVGDRVNQELKAYGANLLIIPANEAATFDENKIQNVREFLSGHELHS